MQKTNFPFEIIIHDDASTDGTADIVKKYAKKHPDIFKTIFEKENQYSKKTWRFLNDMFYSAHGKYIALCEGDDFWTDENKLQKQVDFLEKNKDHTVCFHTVKIFFDDASGKEEISPEPAEGYVFDLENLLIDNYIHTCSVMYRRQDYKNLANEIMPHDLYMHVYHARSGKIGFIKDVMGVYRKQPNGVWWESRDHISNIYERHRYMLINLYSELLKMLKDSTTYTPIIYKHVTHLFRSFIEIDASHKQSLFIDTVRDFPEMSAQFAIQQKVYIDDLKTENQRLSDVVNGLDEEIKAIKGSHWYRLNPKLKRK